MVNPSGFGGRDGKTRIRLTSTVMLRGRRMGGREGRKEGRTSMEGAEDRQIPKRCIRSHFLEHLYTIACCRLWSDFPFYPVSFSIECVFKIQRRWASYRTATHTFMAGLANIHPQTRVITQKHTPV